MASLILAIRFLTIIPVPGRRAHGLEALGRAGWWFPVVGLGLGAILALADAGLRRLFPPLISAALVLALWKGLTGGIHLDGLADCLDGLAGRDHAHRRAIMKDSSIGVFGAIGVALVLLLGWAALAEAPGTIRGRVLLLAPALGRSMPLVMGRIFRARAIPGGLGARFAAGIPTGAFTGWGTAMLAGCALLLWPCGVLVWLVALIAAAASSAFFVARLGGLAGDILGASLEIGELACLLAAISCSHLRIL
jgi:adenosylcobinamide-GDP ribazoletransferase